MPFQLREFLIRHGLTGPGVAAVSGGADSVALLLALLEGGLPVTVGHVHHGLRGDDADADQNFVRDLCDRLGVPFFTARVDVTAAGGNWEAAARKLRYEWLTKLAGDVGATWIATGHTADDQAETVLHRMIRGTGLHGLRGIAEIRKLSYPLSPASGTRVGVRGNTLAHLVAGPLTLTRVPEAGERGLGSGTPLSLVRPLLQFAKADLLHYLESSSQPYRTDATNFDPRYTRSRLRHDLLPKLVAARSSAVADLCRIASLAAESCGKFDRLAGCLLNSSERPRASTTLIFDTAALRAAHPVLACDLFRIVWTRERWPANPMTAAHWHLLAALTEGDYPGRIRLRVRGRVVQLGPAA